MIKVLHKAFNILEFLSASPNGETLTAIARHIGEKTTTVSNIVQVLVRRNYLERVDGRYRLGVSAYLLTGSAADYDRVLCTLAEPVLRRLSEQTTAASVLSVWRGAQRYVLMRVADESDVTVNHSYPDANGVFSTATGMMLLACQSDETIAAYLDSHGIPGIPAPSEIALASFRAQLAGIREQGYYLRDKGHIFEAAACVGDSLQQRTAVGIFLPSFRVEDRMQFVEYLCNAARELTASLSGRY